MMSLSPERNIEMHTRKFFYAFNIFVRYFSIPATTETTRLWDDSHREFCASNIFAFRRNNRMIVSIIDQLSIPSFPYGRGEEAQVYWPVARTPLGMQMRGSLYPVAKLPDVERLRFLSRVLRDPRWRNVSKAWRGANRHPSHTFLSRGIISRGEYLILRRCCVRTRLFRGSNAFVNRSHGFPYTVRWENNNCCVRRQS